LISSNRIRPRSLLPLVLMSITAVIVFGQAGSSRAAAQEPAQTITQNAAQSSNAGTQRSTEKADSTDVYRHSAPVRWTAKHLHVSVETAAKIFEDLNSGVVIAAIVIFLVRKLPVAFRQRREAIQTALVDARSATEQANERLTVVEERLSRLDSEIEAIRQQAERDGVQDEVRIKQSLEDERKRIVESAEHEIESAGVAAQRRLKQFAAELAIERATRDLRLTPEADRLLVSNFGKQLGSDLGKGGRN
jgi:F-type H+-transporting ATPase subunit b